MSNELISGFALFVGGVLLFVVEILIPSGGIIGIAAGIVAVSGVVAFWMEGPLWGLSSTLFLIVMIPLAFQFAVKVMPHTPFGKMLILGSEEDGEREEFDRIKAEAAEHERVESLIGRQGVAQTDLRPGGAANFNGEHMEVNSERGVIEAGTPVVITHVEGTFIKVRQA